MPSTSWPHSASTTSDGSLVGRLIRPWSALQLAPVTAASRTRRPRLPPHFLDSHKSGAVRTLHRFVAQNVVPITDRKMVRPAPIRSVSAGHAITAQGRTPIMTRSRRQVQTYGPNKAIGISWTWVATWARGARRMPMSLTAPRISHRPAAHHHPIAGVAKRLFTMMIRPLQGVTDWDSTPQAEAHRRVSACPRDKGNHARPRHVTPTVTGQHPFPASRRKALRCPLDYDARWKERQMITATMTSQSALKPFTGNRENSRYIVLSRSWVTVLTLSCSGWGSST